MNYSTADFQFDSEKFMKEFKLRAGWVDAYLNEYFTQKKFPVLASSEKVGLAGIQNLLEAVRYSVCDSGKRFRPVLSVLVAESLSCSLENVLPFCASLEMIHCYSLIHDDLPCMDNDDIRRGKPTNHKIFGEDVALLAGDALLTESFVHLADFYSQKKPQIVGGLVSAVGQAAGLAGMIGGQAMDMYSDRNKNSLVGEKSLSQMHYLKTGKLIEVSVVGVGLIAGVESVKQEQLRTFGQKLGVAFQVADDLLDQHQQQEHHKSFVGLLGAQGSKDYLEKLNLELCQLVDSFSENTEMLKKLILFNSSRQV